MKLRTTLLAAAVAAALPLGAAQAKLIATVTDLIGGGVNIFSDLDYGIPGATVIGTQGLINFSSITSPILGTYFQGAATLGVSNYADATIQGILGTASFNLSSLTDLGDVVAINVLADEYLNPAGIPLTFTSTVNAATLGDATDTTDATNASYDFVVNVQGVGGSATLQSVLNVADLTTYQASASYPWEVPYSIQHALRLGTTEVGVDIGIDMSTRAEVIPAPAPLALFGLGLLGLGLTRRVTRRQCDGSCEYAQPALSPLLARRCRCRCTTATPFPLARSVDDGDADISLTSPTPWQIPTRRLRKPGWNRCSGLTSRSRSRSSRCSPSPHWKTLPCWRSPWHPRWTSSS